MRYTLKNLGPGNFFCVEVGKLLQPGDSVPVNRLDYGTKRLAEPPSPRLQIIDHVGARLESSSEPARSRATEPAAPLAPASSSPAPVAPASAEDAALAAGKTGKKAAPAGPKREPTPVSAPTPAPTPTKAEEGVPPAAPVARADQNS